MARKCKKHTKHCAKTKSSANHEHKLVETSPLITPPAGTCDKAASSDTASKLSSVDTTNKHPEVCVSKRRRYVISTIITAIIIGLCALMYTKTADYPMVFDDSVYLKNNPLIKDTANFGYLTDFRELVKKPQELGIESDLATNFALRPVAYATFHINYLLDGFNPRWFRAVNIFVHCGTAIVIYFFLSLLLRQSERPLAQRSITFIAATSALLFAAHPLATESVTYIAQRFTSMGAFFYMLALLCHFLANAMQIRARRWILRGSAVIFAIMGMLTKESTVTMPIMAVMLDWILVGTPLKRSLRRATMLLLCLPIVPLQVMLISWAMNDGSFSLQHSINITNLKDLPWNHMDYAITQLTVVLSYLRRLFWPVDMSIDPEWPLYKSLLVGPVLLAMGVFAAMIAASWALWRRYRYDKRFACIFAFILWYFVTISISSGLVPLPDLMAEHRCYLPSLGIFIAVACLLDRLRTSEVLKLGKLMRITAPTLSLASVLALSITTVKRNDVWSNRISLWEDTIAKSPGRHRAWNNLGAAYQVDLRYDDALKAFEKAKELEPRYEVPYLNRAICFNLLNRCKDAVDELNALIKLSPKADKNLDVQYQYSVALLGLGRVDQAMTILQQITETVPTHRPSHVMIGFVYSRNNMPGHALKYWKKAIDLGPASPQLAQLIQQAEEAHRNGLE